MSELIIQERQQWLDARRKGIGGSDAAAILGLSPWRTPLDVYQDKTGEAPDQEDNAAMFWGRALEPVIRQAYSDQTGRTVRTPDMFAHPRHDWMLANVDGVTDDDRALEIKTTRTGKDWGEEGTDSIPWHYLCQVQHYMAASGLSVADVAVLIGGSDFRLYEVPADPEMQAALIEAEERFWLEHVHKRIPPEPSTFAEAQQRWGHSDASGSFEVGDLTAETARELADLNARIKSLEGQAKEHKCALMEAFGDTADTITYQGRVLATWKLAKAPRRFDKKAFGEDHPELLAKYTVAGTPSRRLLLKEAKS